MNIKLREVAAWSITNHKAHWALLLLQTVGGGSGVVYSMFPAHKDAAAVLFSGSVLVLILWTLFVLFIGHRFGINVLIANLETGILYDNGTDIENVSLRRKTIANILQGVLRESGARKDILREIGSATGSSFVRDYMSYLRKHRKKSIQNERMLEELLEYDSSSGMGKIELIRMNHQPGDYAEILIKNPFTCADGNYGPNGFFLGYIEGIMDALYKDRQFEASIPHRGDCVSELRVHIKERKV